MREARADGALRIVAAQLDLLVGDVDGNCRRLCEAAEQARDEFAADCIVFPELSLLAYPPEDLLLVPAVVARAAEALERIRERVSGITVIAGLPRRVDGCLYNSAAVIADGEVLGIYDKQRLPNYGVFDELRYFRPGHRPLVVRIGGIAVGLSICEDVWRPERIRIRFLDRDFRPQELRIGGMLARVIQHEYDHLEGILFVDHITPFRRRLLRRRLRDMARGLVEAEYPIVTAESETA